MVVYRLITCGTVEEKIYRKQVFKGALARAGTEEANPMRYFTHDELGRLFEASTEGLDVSQTQLHLNRVCVRERACVRGWVSVCEREQCVSDRVCGSLRLGGRGCRRTRLSRQPRWLWRSTCCSSRR